MTKAKSKKWHCFIDNSYDSILIKRHSKFLSHINKHTTKCTVNRIYQKQFCRPYEKCIIPIVLAI